MLRAQAEPSGGRQFVDWKIIFESSLIVPTLLYHFYSSLNKFLIVRILQLLFLETLDW